METVVSGWITVAALVLAFGALALATCAMAMRGPLSALAVVFLALPAIGLLATTVLGDVSRYTPPNSFSDGFDGLNQIVMASALCSILGGIALSAAVVWLIVRVYAALKPLPKAETPNA